MSTDKWNAGEIAYQDEDILKAAVAFRKTYHAPSGAKDGDAVDLEKGGVKYDGGKPRMDLLPMDALFAIACVFTYGALKYDDWNWAKGMRRGRILAALLRHVAAYSVGEEYDAESGLPHSWHMGCCVLMLISGDLRGVAMEDRSYAVQALRRVQATFRGMNDPRVNSAK